MQDASVVLFVLYITSVKGDGGCRVLEFLDCVKNKTFVNHVIKTFRISVPGLQACKQKCFFEDRCVSYNLGPIKGMERSCELNDADHVSHPGYVVSKDDFEYCPVKNPCFSSPCSSNKWCAPNFYWNTFKCSDGRLTQWSEWSPCRCPQTRHRACMSPMNTSLPSSSCEESNLKETKNCKFPTEFSGCSRPLGMQDGSIQDEQITASSIYSLSYKPFYGRLHHSRSWAAQSDSQIGEYLQIDLGSIKWVSKIASQGLNSYDEWITEYALSFANDTRSWEDYRGKENCTKIFIGNVDENTVVTRELPVPIKTRYVRILPQAWHDCISLRIELYGCKST